MQEPTREVEACLSTEVGGQQSVGKQLASAAEDEKPPTGSMALKSLKAVVLLGGSVRATGLTHAVGRSVLDLPIDVNLSVLEHWKHHVENLAQDLGIDRLTVRVVIDRKGLAPVPCDPVDARAVVKIERDPFEYRGTAGLLHDLAERYDDDNWILVAGACQILLDPLPVLVHALAATNGDVVLVSHEDGTPSSLMLIRCQCLRSIPRVGFVDMKEQALSTIATDYRVAVVNRAQLTCVPIGGPDLYIRAVRSYHQRSCGRGPLDDPLQEDWREAFSLVEDSECVDPSAQIYDSVVLRGARVESGAVVVRSIVCPQAVVRRNGVAMDSVITARNGGAR